MRPYPSNRLAFKVPSFWRDLGAASLSQGRAPRRSRTGEPLYGEGSSTIDVFRCNWFTAVSDVPGHADDSYIILKSYWFPSARICWDDAFGVNSISLKRVNLSTAGNLMSREFCVLEHIFSPAPLGKSGIRACLYCRLFWSATVQHSTCFTKIRALL